MNTDFASVSSKVRAIIKISRERQLETDCNFIKKETLAQVFSCEVCEIFKNAFFYRTPSVAACEGSHVLNLLLPDIYQPTLIHRMPCRPSTMASMILL